MTTAIILAGHGSHISPETGGLVWRQVDRLRALGIADEVTAAFWKEQPSFHTVLGTLVSDDITVIPMFTATGYFTQTVIPTEMGFHEKLRDSNAVNVRYARHLGDHPAMSEMLLRRVRQVMADEQLEPGDTAIAVIGHSTKRNLQSRLATIAQVEALQRQNVAAEVIAVYLDDEPEIPSAYQLARARNLIAVPYFLANGSHTTIDVPRELGLRQGSFREQIDGRNVFYTAAMGDDDSLTSMIVDLAAEAGAKVQPRNVNSLGHSFPQRGSQRFVQTILQQGEVRFGELCIKPDRIHVWNDPSPIDRIDSFSDLRAAVREKPFRPLASSLGLPTGWFVDIDEPWKLHAVVETIYPGVIAAWAAGEEFTPNDFVRVIERQTGQFRALAGMSFSRREDLVDRVCGSCILQPTWHIRTRSGIPCAEPCNLWLSEALEDDANG